MTRDKFFSGIVKHKRIVIIAFILMAVISIPLMMRVKVNYDMTKYLPEDSPSTVALEKMDEEFEGGVPNARVMIQDVSIEQAFVYKYSLSSIDGVLSVSWMDDAISLDSLDINSLMQLSQGGLPMDIDNQPMIGNYYKDNTAIYSLTIDEEKATGAVEEIRELIGDDNAVTGNAVAIADATTSTVNEVALSSVISVALVILILLITTDYWLEPVIILAGLGLAITINAGTNIIFWEISFVTNAAGSILQLAVSLDYSVFLFHRFNEARKDTDDDAKAMVFALKKSLSSILSSGMTTIIGFLALVLMQYKIGPDLGLALAKGVALSLITVFVFMPAFFLVTLKLVDKTKHRRILPGFHGFGRVVAKIAVPVSLICVLAIAPAYVLSNKNSFYYGATHMFDDSSRLGRDTAKIEEAFGKNDVYILMLPVGNDEKVNQLSSDISEREEVLYVMSETSFESLGIPEEYFNEGILDRFRSDNYVRLLIGVNLSADGDDTFAFVKDLRNMSDDYFRDEYYLAGAGVTTYDLMDTTTSDMVKVNLIAVLAVFVILLVSMRSALLPLILVASIELAIWLNISVPALTGNSVFYVAYLIISAIQLGATVDYAILMADRYKEKRALYDKKVAVINTISEVTIPIMTSGMALVIVGFLQRIMCSNRLLAQLGSFIGIGAVLSLSIVFVVLPGYLMLMDKFIIRRTGDN